MDTLEEVRYPWINAAEFFGGGYVMHPGASHLLLGWLFAAGLFAKVLLLQRQPLAFRLSVLYFSLTVFTNPAFSIAGLNLNELFGVLAVLSLTPWRQQFVRADFFPVVSGLLLVGVVGLIHGLLVSGIYPRLITDMTSAVTKFAVNAKIFVLAINLLIVANTLRRGHSPEAIVKPILWAGVAALCLYLLQAALLLNGVAPYGTFLDAGYVGVPSFGSMSIERGHFGKFMASYYAFFLFALVAWRWRWRFLLLALVTLVNFSSSSQMFFLFFCLFAAWQFRRQLSTRRWIALGGAVAAGLGWFIFSFWEVFAAVGVKVYELAIQGDESSGGGRSFSTFLEYVHSYPLGMGYSGSTLRTAPGLPEINAAHFAFVTQYSLLALPILLGYAFLVWRAFQKSGKGHLFRAMRIGVMMSVVVFFSDILWFTPLLWLPFVLIDIPNLKFWPPGPISQLPRRTTLAAGIAKAKTA